MLRRIDGFDLFSCGAKYHPSCRRAYIRDPGRGSSCDQENIQEQAAVENAHAKHLKGCAKLSMTKWSPTIKWLGFVIWGKHVSSLKETSFPNPNYRAEKVKKKLENVQAYKGHLGFCPYGATLQFHSYLLYNLKTEVEEVIKASYELGCGNDVEKVARILRDEILQRFQEADKNTWPLTVQDLDPDIPVVRKLLRQFLKAVLSGDTAPSDRVDRLVNSIGQDICRAVSKGQWKLPNRDFLPHKRRDRSRRFVVIFHNRSFSWHRWQYFRHPLYRRRIQLPKSTNCWLQLSFGLLCCKKCSLAWIICDPSQMMIASFGALAALALRFPQMKSAEDS